MKKSRGIFYNIEGNDGSGKRTQSQILYETIKEHRPVIFLDYPDYNYPTGKLIKSYLSKEISLPLEASTLMYVVDQVKDKPKIKYTLRNGTCIVTNRFSPSYLAYGIAQGMKLKDGLAILNAIGMPRPDHSFLIKVRIKTREQRVVKRGTKLDKHETDTQLLYNVDKAFQMLAEKNIFSKHWHVIDGNRHVEDVAADIKEFLYWLH